MASILGFDGPAIVIFLVLAVYGRPILMSGLYQVWYALVAVFGLSVLAALAVVISNPKDYLTIPSEY